MKKIINNPSDILEEMLSGYISAYSRYYERVPGQNAVILKERRKIKLPW